MKLSDYITALEQLRATHGDLEVRSFAHSGAADIAKGPRLAYLRKKLTGGPGAVKFWNETFEEDEKRGQAVVRI